MEIRQDLPVGFVPDEAEFSIFFYQEILRAAPFETAKIKILMKQLWKNLSVSGKLYAVVGIMGFLIALELFTLIFAMNTLSAVRGYIGGEGQWSKAQKDAIIALQSYAITHDEDYYEVFLSRIKVPLGDKVTRLEMNKPDMNFDIAFNGMVQGNIHQRDIPGMIDLYRRFHFVSHLQNAINRWIDGDEQIAHLLNLGHKLHEDIQRNPNADLETVKRMLNDINELNIKLTHAEDSFSASLGDASRWLEELLHMTLILVVVSVSSFGLFLTFVLGRELKKSLNVLINAAREVGRGNYNLVIPVRTGDELGQLSESLNGMVTSLRQQKTAVNIRDEFLSLASHELKTPLTTLKLQIQMRKRNMEKGDLSAFEPEKMKRHLENEDAQLNRLVRLVEDMLDISRIRVGKFSLRIEQVDIVQLARDVIQRLEVQIRESRSEIELVAPESLSGEWDSYRLEQVFVNLLTNAMKYGRQGKITLSIVPNIDYVEMSVADQGIGISESDQDRIFQQFERAVSSSEASGLGLGLYIVKQIITAHQGEIRVQSEPGKGSIFTIRLPLVTREN